MWSTLTTSPLMVKRIDRREGDGRREADGLLHVLLGSLEQRNTGPQGTERIDRLAKSHEPPRSRIARFLAYEPGVNRRDV
jgi:hypothetical protein